MAFFLIPLIPIVIKAIVVAKVFIVTALASQESTAIGTGVTVATGIKYFVKK